MDLPPFPSRLLRASFLQPEFLVPLLNRKHLIERLDRALEGRLILLQAPAGCGKSTLLVQWHKALRMRDVRCAWFTVPRDLGPSETLLSLAWSLQLAGVDVAETGLLDEGGYEGLNLDHALAGLLAVLSAAEGDFVLILDDFERLQDTASLALVDALASALPPNARLVLASRARPGVGVTRLHARGLVQTLSAADLLLSPEESIALLREDMSGEDAQILHQRTEGWPVAIQLGKFWFRQNLRDRLPLDEFRGHSGDIAAYLMEQVIASIPEDLRGFMIDTSVLDRITPDLAQAVHGGTGARRLLGRLAAFQPLVFVMDRKDEVYRLHPLLADHLRETLRLDDPERFAVLHRAAARRLADQGQLEGALRHAIAAGDRPLACALLAAQDLLGICTSTGTAEIAACLALLSDAEIRQDPRLWVARIFLLGRKGRRAEAIAELAALAQAFPPRDAADVLDRITIEIQVGANALGRSDELVERVRAAGRLDGVDKPFAERLLNTAVCLAGCHLGRLKEAEAAQLALRAGYPDPGAPGSPTYLDLHAAYVELARGDLAAAEATLKRMLRSSRKITGPDRSVLPLAQTLMLWLDYETDRVRLTPGEILDLLETLERSDAWFDYHALAHQAATELAWRAQGKAAALEVVARGRALSARLTFDDSFERILLALECDVLTRAGDITAAQSRIAALPSAPATLPSWQERLTVTRARARLALATGDRATALILSDAVADEATREDRRLLLCRALVIRALADPGGPALTQALALAATDQTPTPFLEFRQEIAPLIATVDESATDADFLSLVRDRLDHHPTDSAALARLSPREREILSLLATEPSNKHIARRADVTEDAVKFHLKNIYRKLGVHTRQEALELSGVSA